jgi:hypothetical protein
MKILTAFKLRDIATDCERVYATVSSHMVSLRQLGEDTSFYRFNPEFAMNYPLDIHAEEDLFKLEEDAKKCIYRCLH